MFARSSSGSILKAIKAAHTIIWAVFVACILAIWVFAWQLNFFNAALSIGIVLVEVIVLVVNGWQCPLTSLATRYTDNQRANFDIYLPEWLARHTKVIFGTLYLAGIAVTFSMWVHAST